MYYCHICAIEQNLYNPIEPDKLSLTSSQYQLEKFIKHTAPTDWSGLISVYNNPDYNIVKDYTINTSASGSVEVDIRGRLNIIYYANRDIGVTYNNGIFITTADTIKVVCHGNTLKIHSFPVDSFIYERKKCIICGGEII